MTTGATMTDRLRSLGHSLGHGVGGAAGFAGAQIGSGKAECPGRVLVSARGTEGRVSQCVLVASHSATNHRRHWDTPPTRGCPMSQWWSALGYLPRGRVITSWCLAVARYPAAYPRKTLLCEGLLRALSRHLRLLVEIGDSGRRSDGAPGQRRPGHDRQRRNDPAALSEPSNTFGGAPASPSRVPAAFCQAASGRVARARLDSSSAACAGAPPRQPLKGTACG